MTDAIVFGLDPGNSEATGVVAPRGKGSVLTIPSDIGAGSLRELTRIRGGSGQHLRLDPGEYVLEVDGSSAFVTRAVEEAGQAESIARQRALRVHFLSNAAVQEILGRSGVPSRSRYRGDFQMHSTWSDGAESVEAMAEACIARGYRSAGMTDHSYGLPIAGGMTTAIWGMPAADIRAWLKKMRPKCSRSGNTSACKGRNAPPESTR